MSIVFIVRCRYHEVLYILEAMAVGFSGRERAFDYFSGDCSRSPGVGKSSFLAALTEQYVLLAAGDTPVDSER